MILRRYRTQNQAFRGQDVVHARQTIYPVRGRPPVSARRVRYGTAREPAPSKRPTSIGLAIGGTRWARLPSTCDRCGTSPWPRSPCSASAAPRARPPPAISHVVLARDNSNGKTVRVSVGERLELILASDYWNVDPSSSPAVLRQDGQTRYLAPPSDCPTMSGLGCIPEQTSFTALARGTVVITASRTSCGEAMACRPDQRHFRLTVIVR